MSDLPLDQLEQLVQGYHWDPLAILGAHPTTEESSPTVAIRFFLPEARDVALLLNWRGRQSFPMTRLHEAGLFEAIVPGPLGTSRYRLQITNHRGQVSERHDSYAFLPLLTDFALHLFAEGTFFKAYETMCAHVAIVHVTA